ncbi:MAG: hypothetical protein ACOX6D_08715, partial [Thermoguttaceae bacterium]
MGKLRERSLRLESLEDRFLLAVVAGGEESATAVYAVDAEPMATAAVQLDTPTNVQAVCNVNNRVQVSWDAVPNASQYTVYSQKVGATNWKATVATGTSVTVSGLMATGAYAFKVVANGDGTNYTDSEESAVVKCYPHTSYSTVVTTLTDIKETYTPSGDISFRQAVYFASTTGDTVTFAEGLAGTADLATFGQITLTGGLTIDGDNRITLTNTGTAVENRLFSVGASDAGFDVFLRNLTFTGFSVTQTGEDYVWGRGGAIVVWNTRFNPANNNFVNFTLDHCSVTDCFAADCGGFFYAYGGTIQSTNSTFSENVARQGGAVGLLAGDVFLTDSVFTGNTATGTTSAEGGALYLNTSYGSVIDNCEFSNNTASISSRAYGSDDSAIGGAIYLLNGDSINIYDSQITNNTATCVGSGDGSSYCCTTMGGGIYTDNVTLRIYNSEITGNSAQYGLVNIGGGLYIDPSGREVFLYMTNVSENFIGYKDYDLWAGGGAGNCPSRGGAIYAGGVFHMVNCTVLDNILYGSRANNQIGQMSGSAIYGNTGMALYNTTIAGNRVLASSVAYSTHQATAGCPDYSGIVEYGSGTLISCVVLGNYYEDTDTGVKTDSDIYSHAWMHSSNDMVLNSCVYNPDALDKDAGEDWPGYTPGPDGWNFDIRANSIAVTDYEAFFNDYAAGDYTLASGSVGIDAADMDVWASFGYEYDIRGEGYSRLINNVADIGAYEFQSAAPTFEVTIIDYTGDFDGEYHSISISGLEEGDVVSYSEDGINYSGTILSYANPGTYTVYVKVERSGYQDFTGSGTVTINEVFTKMQVAVIVSDGAASATEVAVLPESITTASVGQTVYAQVWILNADSSELGCTGGYIDLDYTSAIEAGSFTVSSIYASQATYCDSSVP